MAVMDWTEPNVCVDENIIIDQAGQLRIAPWAVPRVVRDVKAVSSVDGTLFPTETMPGKKMIDQKVPWRNTDPIPVMVRILVTRGPKMWITSNPNAIQFRDRWTYTIGPRGDEPTEPLTTSIYNSQCGSAIDCGTNSVAEPNPGKEWVWIEPNCSEEWIGPVAPGDKVMLWYQQYVWTPPPFSDNANKNKPEHKAYANWTRVSLWSYPMQPGNLVVG